MFQEVVVVDVVIIEERDDLEMIGELVEIITLFSFCFVSFDGGVSSCCFRSSSIFLMCFDDDDDDDETNSTEFEVEKVHTKMSETRMTVTRTIILVEDMRLRRRSIIKRHDSWL